MKTLLASCFVIASSTLAPWCLAQGSLDPPRYDSSVLCYQRATVAEGFSREAMMQCLGSQRQAYEQTRKIWLQLPEEIQTGCDEHTRATRVLDYVSLYSCIVTQLRRIPPAAAYDSPTYDSRY